MRDAPIRGSQMYGAQMFDAQLHDPQLYDSGRRRARRHSIAHSIELSPLT